MFDAIKTSRYIQLSLGLNALMLVMSFVSVALFGFFTGGTWLVFLLVGIVVIALFFVSIVGSLVYLFVGKVPLKYRFIPLAANLSMFFLFPLTQQLVLTTQNTPASNVPQYDTAFLLANIDAFNEMAEYKQDHYIANICRFTNNAYEIGGDYFDFDKNNFVRTGSPFGAEKSTFEQLLELGHTSSSTVRYFSDFLERFPGVQCIDVQLNLKVQMSAEELAHCKQGDSSYTSCLEKAFKEKFGETPPSVVDVILSPREGFLYVWDGTVDEAVREDYRIKTFKVLEPVPDTKWFRYETYEDYAL